MTYSLGVWQAMLATVYTADKIRLGERRPLLEICDTHLARAIEALVRYVGFRDQSLLNTGEG